MSEYVYSDYSKEVTYVGTLEEIAGQLQAWADPVPDNIDTYYFVEIPHIRNRLDFYDYFETTVTVKK